MMNLCSPDFFRNYEHTHRATIPMMTILQQAKFYTCSLELIFCDTLAHRSRRTNTAGHHLQHVVDIVGTTPLLMCKHVDLVLSLRLLDDLAVSTHAVLGVRLGEGIGHESSLVQTSEGDELPAVAESGKTLDVRLLLIARHSALPIEGWRKVVRKSVRH